MSRRQIRALALSFALALTLSGPAVAATRDGAARDRDVPFIEKVMARLKGAIRSFTDTLTLPKP